MPKIEALSAKYPRFNIDSLYKAIGVLKTHIGHPQYMKNIGALEEGRNDILYRLANFATAPEPEAQRFYRDSGPEILYAEGLIAAYSEPFKPECWGGAPSKVLYVVGGLINSIELMITKGVPDNDVHLFLEAFVNKTPDVFAKISDWPVQVDLQIAIHDVLFGLMFLSMVVEGNLGDAIEHFENVVNAINSIGFKPAQKTFMLTSLFSLGGDDISVIEEGMAIYPGYLSDTLIKLLSHVQRVKFVQDAVISGKKLDRSKMTPSERRVVDRVSQNVEEHKINFGDDSDAPTLNEFLDDSVINLLFFEMMATNAEARYRLSLEDDKD